MAARRFGNKYNRSQRCLVACGDERGHTNGGIQAEGGAVDNGLTESCPNTPSGKKQRNKHGADAARSEGKEGRAELEHAKSEELGSAVVIAQDFPHSLVIRADRYEITGIDMKKEQSAKSRE